MTDRKSPRKTGIGRNLCILRRNTTTFSQKDIADLLGIDRNTYASWESELTDVKSEYIPKLAEIFKISINQLFEKNIQTKDAEAVPPKGELINAIIVLSDQPSIERLVSSLKDMLSVTTIK